MSVILLYLTDKRGVQLAFKSLLSIISPVLIANNTLKTKRTCSVIPILKHCYPQRTRSDLLRYTGLVTFRLKAVDYLITLVYTNHLLTEKSKNSSRYSEKLKILSVKDGITLFCSYTGKCWVKLIIAI